MLYNVACSIDRKILPFLNDGSPIEIRFIQTESDGSAIAEVNLDLRNGVTPLMLASVSPANVSLDFAQGIEQVDGQTNDYQMEPALPHVESDYDEVRDKVGQDLGQPVQTLFGSAQPMAQDQTTQKIAQTNPNI